MGQYDFALSTRYRDWFQVMLAGSPQLRGALQGSGPFLVATRVPMNELVATAAGQRTITLDSRRWNADCRSGQEPGDIVAPCGHTLQSPQGVDAEWTHPVPMTQDVRRAQLRGGRRRMV